MQAQLLNSSPCFIVQCRHPLTAGCRGPDTVSNSSWCNCQASAVGLQITETEFLLKHQCKAHLTSIVSDCARNACHSCSTPVLSLRGRGAFGILKVLFCISRGVQARLPLDSAYAEGIGRTPRIKPAVGHHFQICDSPAVCTPSSCSDE